MTQADTAFNEGQRIIERVMRRLQLRVYQAVTIVTPVDTGWVRSKWEPTIRSSKVTQIKRPKDRTVAQTNAAAAFAKNLGIAKALSTGYKIGNGRIIRIVNPVIYLPFLNAGSSVQAPARFIERAVRKAKEATMREIRGSGVSLQ
jgi:hypothetical protein